MLSISLPIANASAAVAYYLDRKLDYYLAGIDQKGYWLGSGAAALGLLGQEVDRNTFRHLLEGFSPDGLRPLVQNAGHSKRQCGWDLTFNAPKAVSVLQATASAATAQRIDLADQSAIQAALLDLEQIAGVTRRGEGGRIEEPAGLIFAVFQEHTSRSLDAHVHTHVLVINLAVRRDGTTGALHSTRFFEKKMVLGQKYRDHLAHQLQGLGLTIEPQRVGFHIAGVPRELCRAHSQRRQQIERWLAEHGLQGPVAARRAALATRPRKVHASRDELRACWQQMAGRFGWGTAQAENLLRADQQHVTGPQRLADEPRQQATQDLDHSRVFSTKPGQAYSESGPTKGPGQAAVTKVNRPLQRVRLLHTEWKRLFDKTPWIPPKGRLIHTEWKPLFPNAPWSRARQLKLPVVVAEFPKIVIGPHRGFRPRWWTIRWKRDLVLGELRVQQKFLFPKAPKWSPVHGLSLPAFHFSAKKSKWRPVKPVHTRMSHSH